MLCIPGPTFAAKWPDHCTTDGGSFKCVFGVNATLESADATLSDATFKRVRLAMEPSSRSSVATEMISFLSSAAAEFRYRSKSSLLTTAWSVPNFEAIATATERLPREVQDFLAGPEFFDFCDQMFGAGGRGG